MYKKLLVGVYSSDEASQVLSAVASWQWISEAEVSVLHVAEHPPLSYGQWMVYLPIDESEVEKHLLQRVEERVTASGLKPHDCRIVFGRAVDTLLKEAEEGGFDLIVVGSHGRHGVKLLLGSTANGVLHRAGCDVMAIRIRED